MNKPHERRFRFTTLETSDSIAKGTIRLRIISWSFLDVWNLEERQDNEDTKNVKILIFVVNQAVLASFIDFLQALTLQIHL